MHVTRRARHVWLPTLAHHPSGSPMLHPSPVQRRCVQRGCRSAGCMHRQIPRTAAHQQLPRPPLRVGAFTHEHARCTTRTFTPTSTRARHTSANRGAETAHLAGRASWRRPRQETRTGNGPVGTCPPSLNDESGLGPLDRGRPRPKPHTHKRAALHCGTTALDLSGDWQLTALATAGAGTCSRSQLRAVSTGNTGLPRACGSL